MTEVDTEPASELEEAEPTVELKCRKCNRTFEQAVSKPDADVCPRCVAQMRARKLLGEAPDLVAHILAQVAPSIGGGQGQRVDGGDKASLPLNVNALEDANNVYAQLANWSLSHARLLRKVAPASILGLAITDTDCYGFPSWAHDGETSAALVASVVDWLLAYDVAIGRTSVAERYWADVKDIVSPLFGRYPRAPRREVFASRSCLVCGRRTVIVNLPDDDEPLSVACTFCGHVVPSGHAAEYLDKGGK